MSELGHKYVEETTIQTHSGDTNWDTILTLSNTDLAAGTKYLLWAIVKDFGSASSSVVMGCRIAHGATPTSFTESEHYHEGMGASGWYVYNFFIEWTAISSEDVVLQIKTYNEGSPVRADQMSLCAIDLDGLAAGDYYYDSYTTDTDLSATPADGAEITFTPANNNDDWLVASVAALVPDDDLTPENGSRIEHGADVAPRAQRQGEDITERFMLGLVRPYTLANTSQTFTEQSYCDTTNNSRVYSAIFALRLNAFKDHAIYWVEADIGDPLSTTDYATEVGSTSITPSQTGKDNTGNVWMKYRQQVYQNGQSEVDQPPTQTSDAYQENEQWFWQDELPCQVMTVESLTASTQYDIDLDASEEVDTTHCEDRAIVAFTFELAAAAGAPAGLVRIIGT
jgi:hypothetical protein